MEWTPGTIVALVALAVTVLGHVVSVTYFLAKSATHAKNMEGSLGKLEAKLDTHLERLYGKVDSLVVSQQEVAALRSTVEQLRERLRRVESQQDGRR